ncbi:MAG: hypothetical protein HQL16_05700 [Candidatus Omnitrophica bacterium]|nr:hypothetical protein [Candidatus Omnitrophota bacterium]
MKHTHPVFAVILTTVFSLIFFSLAQAAEIININYRYKVAFTDLTETDVRANDLVNVTTSDGKTVHLKVLEAFPVMAKLTIPDGDETLTDDQFSRVVVGSKVVPASSGNRTAAPKIAAQESRPPQTAAKEITRSSEAEDDTPAHVEKYSPAEAVEPSYKTPVQEETKPVVHEPVKKDVVEKTEALSDASSKDGCFARMTALETRLDQMMAHNVKLTENISQLLTEKNEATALAHEKEAKEAAARAKAEDLTSQNGALLERVKSAESAKAALEQDNAAERKEIENLNLKLGELKKKLARMVEIVNANMKAYEKQ